MSRRQLFPKSQFNVVEDGKRTDEWNVASLLHRQERAESPALADRIETLGDRIAARKAIHNEFSIL